MKDVPIKGGKRNTSLGYQTKTTRNSSLKRTLDDALRTHGTSNNQNHNRSKSEMFNTILGFIEKNGNDNTRNEDYDQYEDHPNHTQRGPERGITLP